jgi:hypothetical protein
MASTRLTVGLKGGGVGLDERSRPAGADRKADDIAAAVVVLDKSPDDDGIAAVPGVHLGAVQGRRDLEDLHAATVRPKTGCESGRIRASRVPSGGG